MHLTYQASCVRRETLRGVSYLASDDEDEASNGVIGFATILSALLVEFPITLATG